MPKYPRRTATQPVQTGAPPRNATTAFAIPTGSSYRRLLIQEGTVRGLRQSLHHDALNLRPFDDRDNSPHNSGRRFYNTIMTLLILPRSSHCSLLMQEDVKRSRSRDLRRANVNEATARPSKPPLDAPPPHSTVTRDGR